ncbi:copine-3-like isoform X2 [Centruroides vittatus]|uniref:copine-3-like isoform X2 n=1 Tax=Centruroides vittatus TaxID=120091 RepID=UPI00350EDB48
MAHFQPPSACNGPPPTMCVTQVEILCSCRNLLDKDIMSKSDPVVVLYLYQGGGYIEKGRTEIIKNSLNPDFCKPIKVDYFFEEVQKLKFCVYDIDNETITLADDDYLGGLECTMGEVVSSSPFTRNLISKFGQRLKSTITIRAQEVGKEGKDLLSLSFHAKNLDDKDFFSKSDPFLEFRVKSIDGNWHLVHRTEVIMNNLNPVWKPFQINMQSFGGNNVETSILISCFDHESDGNHDFIGKFTTTFAEILEAQHRQVEWPCINEKKMKKMKKKNYKNSGIIYLSSCKIIKNYTFLDYIFGGTQINFTVAIDFTGSNGNPRDPNSLHYISSHPNDYMKAIWAVGNVIQDYDSDKMFPALGFGARIPPTWEVSHEFAINFNNSNPFCSGVQGIIDAYRNCITQVQLYGPTNFSPVINHVARFAQHAHNTCGNYFILLILTDGVVTDMNETRRAIVQASRLPMSIIIVGVGRADFEAMDFLDSDNQRLCAPDGTYAERDIVQFVPFYKYEMSSPEVLAREVLAELPQQVTQYFMSRNIPPNPPRQASAPLPMEPAV